MGIESRVCAEIDGLAGGIAELASRLISVPSTSPNLVADPASVLGGEAACNRLVAAALAAAGLEIDLVEPAPERVNVVGVLAGSGGGRSLALNGHVDTVPPGALERWTVDPYGGEIRDGRVWGRGATDMKGALAAIVGAVEAIARCGVRLRGDLVVQSVVGEELRDPEGIRSVLERGYVTDGCICAEPSVELREGRQLGVHVISSPAVLLRVTLRGRSTHSCLRHEWIHPGGRAAIGVNAIEKGVGLVTALQELERAWGLEKRHPLFPPGKFFLHPGYFHGGPAHGSGPYFPAELCTVEYIIWHHPDETAAAVKQEVGDWIARWASLDPWLREHPPELDWWGDFVHHELDPDHELVRAVAGAHERAVGAPPRVGAFPAGADATVLAEFGVPTLIYGPGEIAMAHAVDEHVLVEELVQAAKVYAVTALRWCETDDSVR